MDGIEEDQRKEHMRHTLTSSYRTHSATFIGYIQCV